MADHFTNNFMIWNVQLDLIDPQTKEVVDTRRSHNYVTNIGKAFFTRVIAPATTSGTPNPYASTNPNSGWQQGTLSGISVGTSSANAGDVTMTGLAAEIAGSKQIIQSLTYPASGVLNVQTTFGTGSANGALQEAGLWGGYGPVGDIMVARNTFGTINKTTSFELAVSWTLTFS